MRTLSCTASCRAIMRGWVVNDPQGVHTIPTHSCVAGCCSLARCRWSMALRVWVCAGFRVQVDVSGKRLVGLDLNEWTVSNRVPKFDDVLQ